MAFSGHPDDAPDPSPTMASGPSVPPDFPDLGHVEDQKRESTTRKLAQDFNSILYRRGRLEPGENTRASCGGR